jgi:hypothetical protein
VRPRPSEALRVPDELGTFERAHEVEAWIAEAFLTPGSPLYHVEHAHLSEARYGVLWSNIPVRRRGVQIAGMASMPRPHPALSAYDKQAQVWFIRQFFGIEPLDFLITLDAPYAATCEDINFLALAKHELIHCGQKHDAEGEPLYSKTHKPKFCIQGHDVEEQIAVVRDFGLVGRNVAEFVRAASDKPRIGRAEIDWACGNCVMRKAA